MKRKGAIEYRLMVNLESECDLVTSYKFIAFNLIIFEMISVLFNIKLVSVKEEKRENL